MSYAEATLKDRNATKRLLQRRRLRDALACVDERLSPAIVIDFGGGAGEFSKRLAARFPGADIFCYEPSPWMTKEAEENLAGTKRIAFVSSLDRLPKGTCDLLYCNEVFEHFPPEEIERAIGQIKGLLSEDGVAVIGVPIEIFVPALLKGAFRMTRRYGAYDSRFSMVLRASAGIPARDRPLDDSGGAGSALAPPAYGVRSSPVQETVGAGFHDPADEDEPPAMARDVSQQRDLLRPSEGRRRPRMSASAVPL